MEDFNRKNHWENIYQTKELEEASWFQPKPKTSLRFIKDINLPFSAKIIDIGGGDSYFVDNLLDLGYINISVLDISSAAIERAKKRLGKRAENVTWIVADIARFEPKEKYDFWHDRAAFHFLTDDAEVTNYVNTAFCSITSGGFMFIGTFSLDGPSKCSGIEIQQYSETQLSRRFNNHFEPLRCVTEDHVTPSNTKQNFIFCSFKKRL